MKKIEGSVTAPKGFEAAGHYCGIKNPLKKRKDLALIYSLLPAQTAGVFTQNKMKAAPVKVSQAVIDKGVAQAIVINSGNANACTGKRGDNDAVRMAIKTGEVLKIDPALVLVSSTGVIGVNLPIDRIEKGIEDIVPSLSADKGWEAAKAILTTDLIQKEVAVEIEVAGKKVRIGGIAKGSGMIHPNMATMLTFMTTDAAVDGAYFKKLVKETADKTFNMISVDGDTSTNDMCLVMANGMAKNEIIDEKSIAKSDFASALTYVMKELAKLIVRDGEGATKLIEVQVNGAKTELDARKIARAITASNLTKSAIFGEDANWGRIICAAGYSGAEIDPDLVDIWIKSAEGEEQMAARGMGLVFDEDNARKILAEKTIYIVLDLNDGAGSAVGWGCDLTYDYVKINADYRT